MSAREKHLDGPATSAAVEAHDLADVAPKSVSAAAEEIVGAGVDAISLEDFIPAPPAVAPATLPAPALALPALAAPSMRTARVLRVDGRSATIALRGGRAEVEAEIAPEVEVEVIEAACANGEAVLVEALPNSAPVIVAALHTRRPQEIHLKAENITVEGAREILLRAGRGAIRIREDGDIEVVGTRISAASRGLFRIVGRILRLN